MVKATALLFCSYGDPVLTRRSLVFFGSLLLAATVAAASGAADAPLTFDANNSQAEFAVQHLAISTVRGTIKITKLDMTTDANSTVPKSIVATLDPATVDSRVADRDKDLRSPHFLDVDKFPTMSFKSTKIVLGDGKKFKIHGDLTLHGVTKPVVLEAEFLGDVKDARGGTHYGYSAVTKFDRRIFGMDFADAMPGGGLIVGWDIDIILNIEVIRRAA